ncbi:hypothetical protein [Aquimarina longa]|uniref:hypothetical protein n=1 Tax=Aquimarina longa TaxID=1080221 RepID=UPI0011DF2840|nr:hypothetical protein [Aquimarina longa]
MIDILPKEHIFIHHNTTLLFSGEYLYYKVYCIDLKTQKKSYLSKIAYVELVGEDKKTVFRHKIRLEEGHGQGDFFIPVAVASGNYKLIGYTQWMKNEGLSSFFQSDINIINPYQRLQKEKKLNDNNQSTNNLLKDVIYESDDENVQLVVNAKNNTKRSAVSVLVKSLKKSLSYGNYSLSVRKIDTILIPSKHTAKKNSEQYKKTEINYTKEVKQHFFTPELRGELIYGKIKSKTPDFKESNKKIVISIPEEEQYQLKIATTDKKGFFKFNLDKKYSGSQALIQVLGDEKQQYDIQLHRPKDIDYSNLIFNTFTITPQMKDMILKRSIYNQINNAYFSVKPDTIKPFKKATPFYGDDIEVYNLDEYTRFPTVKETIVEIIDNVWIDKTRKGKEVFKVRRKNYSAYNKVDLLPLVIIDGLMIQDHNDLINYNPKKIKRIKLSRKKYFYGSHMFLGVIDLETVDKDYYRKKTSNNIHTIELFKPLPEKKYFYQKYNETITSSTDRIPDFRQQLLWIPDFILDKEEIKIDFFTSDNIGDYEISLEGFTNEGVPVSTQTVITVE